VVSLPVLLLILLVGAAIYGGMSPRDRARLVQTAMSHFVRLRAAAEKTDPAADAFEAALREQMPRTLCTLAFMCLNVAVFVCMLFGKGSLAEAATLISWGGNVGPLTGNGGWWRLVTSTFVHDGMFHLLVNMAVLFQIGALLERLAGRALFASVYVTAGIFASLAALSAYPMEVSVGASGAISGLIGLLLATWLWKRWNQSENIPDAVLKRLAPAGGVFFLWNLVSGDVPLRGELAGFVAGLAGGLALTKPAEADELPRRRVVTVAAATFVLLVAFAIPQRGITDVREDIAKLITLESRTAGDYDTAVERFRKGRVPVVTLTNMIGDTIVPQLQAAESRLNAVQKVPSTHQSLLADAREYLRLRTESWRLREEGLREEDPPRKTPARKDPKDPAVSDFAQASARHRARATIMARAEEAERASLKVLERIRHDEAIASKGP